MCCKDTCKLIDRPLMGNNYDNQNCFSKFLSKNLKYLIVPASQICKSAAVIIVNLIYWFRNAGQTKQDISRHHLGLLEIMMLSIDKIINHTNPENNGHFNR